MRTPIYTLIAALLLSLSCEVKPKEISYGEAACHFCRMTVVDPQHAAQLVTQKGKVYNFDAIECMLHHLNEVDPNTIGLLLVSDYKHPGNLIPVESATFIISEGIPSPMGANLSAVSSVPEAQELVEQQGGSQFDWSSLKAHLKH